MISRLYRAAVAAASVAGCLLWAGHATAAAISPHEAQYDLYLDDHALGDGVASSGGHMEIRYERSCETWTTLFRFDFTLSLAEGIPINFTYMSRTEEALDGTTFRFEHLEMSDGEIVRAIAGTAHNSDGAPAEAVFTYPERKRVTLPADTTFPVAAWQDLLNKVGEAPSAAGYTLFDGWDVEGPGALRVWATKSKLDPAAQNDAAAQASLLSGSSWQVSSAYFPFGSSEMEPASSTEERLYESGVSDRIRFDWQELVIRAQAVSVKPLAKPEC